MMLDLLGGFESRREHDPRVIIQITNLSAVKLHQPSAYA